MAPPSPPSVPETELEARGWERVDDRAETVFEGFGVSVRSRTLVYEDRSLRTAVVDAGGPDRIWRFLFVARLEITPPPAFGMHALVRPRVCCESERVFAEQLRERGVERVKIGDSERIASAGDPHAQSIPYRGSIPLDGCDDEDADAKSRGRVAVVGHLVLWYDDGFHVAGWAGPSGPIDGWAEADTDDGALFELIRSAA